MTSGIHSAAGSLIGYIYQVRVALWLAYERMYEDPNLLISLELLDDVQFDSTGNARELLQTKHRARPANLTDQSVDLWKTLGIWLERDEWLFSAERYVLLTTSEAAAGSAAACLLVDRAFRDVATAYELLLVAADESTNSETESARRLFKNRSPEDVIVLLNHVFVMDGAPRMADLDSALMKAFRAACPADRRAVFLSYLEGWWYSRVLSQLGPGGQPIIAEEIDAEVNQLREQMLTEALPIHHDILFADESIIDAEFYKDQVFVTQLQIAGISDPRILMAIVDFYKASEQRSRWVREELVMLGELSSYEKRLKDEWERYFAQVAEEYGEDAGDAEKLRAARAVFNWAQQENPSLRIRPRCEDPFVQRGSFQILANDMTVGWHPDFRTRVAEVLGV